MATVTLTDFEDIYTAVCEELKVQLTDGATVGRIKRDINIVYLNHVIPFKPRAWWWLEKNQDVQTVAKITTGTVTIAADSTTVTFSSAPSVDLDNYWFKVSGYPEVIKISAHTAASSTATLASAWRRGAVTAASYTLWKDEFALDSDMKEVIQVTHEHIPVPLDMKASNKFNEIRARLPEYNGYPRIATIGDFDSSGNRIMRVYPACDTTRYTLHVQGVVEATRLSADSDEPLMPLEDRVVLFYGGCSRAWRRERNESEANNNWQLMMAKLNEMAGKSQDAPKITEMMVDPDYTINKRYRRLYRNRRAVNWERD
jgi:hypothetical protein